MQFASSSVRTQPVTLTKNTESQVYFLFTLAMAMTLLGVMGGLVFAPFLLGSGVQVLFVIAELLLIITARAWINSQPLNLILFIVFPMLSGITVAPYILLVLTGIANGPAILLNALVATVFMTASAAVASRALPSLAGFGRVLLIALIGLLVMGLLQLFIPALRSTGMELLISGLGILLFSGFIAYDLQRIAAMGKVGANPFLMALSLYLDIFNLFLSILRFMVALSGNRK